MTTHERSPAAGGRRAVVRQREDAVEARLRTLGTALDGEPDPAFRTATRTRLVAMAAVRSPAPEPRPLLRRMLAARDRRPAPWRGRLTAALTGAALAVTAAAALVAVAAGARPGDLLYGIKRGTEQTQLALAGDSRGDTLLGFAHTRLTELDGLLQGGPAAQTVVDTLQTMDRQATEGAAWLTARAVATRSTGPVSDLASWTRGQSAGLAALQPRMPAAAAPAAADSADLLGRIGARAQALATALTCPSGPATRGTDALGPVPVACPAPSSAPGSGVAGEAPGGANQPGTAPTPGGATAPPSGLPVPSLPGGGTGGPGPGTGSGPGPGSGSTGGGGSVTPTQPSLPIPPLPLPLPLPGQPAGTTGGSSPTSGGAAPTSGGGSPIGVCLPPIIAIGSC